MSFLYFRKNAIELPTLRNTNFGEWKNGDEEFYDQSKKEKH